MYNNSKSLSEFLLNEFHMLTDWLIRLSKSIDNTSDHELQKVLRFNRWYLRREVDNITSQLEREDIEFSHCLYLKVLYVSYECEIAEFQRALNGKGQVWDAAGTIQSRKEIKKRLKDLCSFRDSIARELCLECRKEAV